MEKETQILDEANIVPQFYTVGRGINEFQLELVLHALASPLWKPQSYLQPSDAELASKLSEEVRQVPTLSAALNWPEVSATQRLSFQENQPLQLTTQTASKKSPRKFLKSGIAPMVQVDRAELGDRG